MAKGKKQAGEVKARVGASKWAACGCKHDFQTAQAIEKGYAGNFRIKICNNSGSWVCTVCGKS